MPRLDSGASGKVMGLSQGPVVTRGALGCGSGRQTVGEKGMTNCARGGSKEVNGETMRGAALAFILYDVCEEIRLKELRGIIGARTVERTFKQNAPEYVRFQKPPLVETLEPVCLDDGTAFQIQIKYYDYGVVSFVFKGELAGDWPDLIQLASKWMAGSEFERHASRIAREKVERAAPAIVNAYPEWLVEDYFLFHIVEIPGNPAATTLIEKCGDRIAQLVRGETARLSESERNEVLQSRISYYPNDLTVIGWHNAFLYDTPTGAETAIQMIEYANSQLLEFRHYDDLLTRELDKVYRSLERGGRVLRRWRMGREAVRLQAVRLEVTELAERADNAIKFLSDMFSARLYRMAATKVGVIDYKNLVNEKLRTADHLYESMIQQFQQGRAFVLELMVVIILIIELVYLFRGKW